MKKEMNNPIVGILIKELREKQSMTQEHLAELAEVNVRTIQRMESNGTYSAENLRGVAEALDVDCKDILSMAEKKFSELKSKMPLVVRANRFKSGLSLLQAIGKCDAFQKNFPDDLNDEQMSVMAQLFDNVQDMMDCPPDCASTELEWGHSLGRILAEAEGLGLWVFGGCYSYTQKCNDGSSLRFRAIAFQVSRSDDPRNQKEEDQEFTMLLIPKS